MFSPSDLPLLGLPVGLLHHLLLQYPRQAPLFTTVLFFLAANSIFAFGIWSYLSVHVVSQAAGKDFFVFNSCYIATALSLKIIYNVFFRHRGIPSKFWLASTDLGYVPICSSGQAHTKIEQLHKTLGDVIRIQPNHISFNSLEAVDAIHGIKTKAKKGELYTHVMRLKATAPLTMFSETDKKHHSFLRRIANPFFSPSFLRELEPTIQRYYKLFINGIKADGEQNGGIVDLTKWIDHCILDVSGALALGKDFKNMESIHEKDDTWVISRRWMFVSRVYAIPWIMPLTWISPSAPKTREGEALLRKWFYSSMETRKEEKENIPTRSYLEALLDASDPETGEKLSPRDTSLLATGFIVAAADTTSSSLVFVLYHCISNRRVWDRLCEEVRSKFASPNDITGQATATMTYLDAVITEGTRLRPAAPANLIRETPPEGMVIAGLFIPGKTQVSTPTWTILHDERHFSHPHEFIPERWIDSERGIERCNKKAYIPFSTGLRNCIGKSLALMQMRVLVATFIWWFDAEVVDEKEPLYEDRFVARRGSLRIRVTPVKRDR